MKPSLYALVVLIAAAVPTTVHADEGGKEVFQRHCSHCHAPGLNRPGTLQLSLTRGEANAVLEQRDNLNPEYVKVIVRQGLNAMPPFKPTVITESELEDLARYLSE